MTREEAIKELYAWLDGCCGDEEIEPAREAFRMAIEALRSKIDWDLPISPLLKDMTNPDKKRFGTDYKTNHGYMWLCPECGLSVHSDFAKCVRCGHERHDTQIVNCKDCKNWDTTWQNDWAKNYHYCPLIDGIRNGDWYCADAERRTNEPD